MSAVDRLLRRTTMVGCCWVHEGARTRDGYGRILVGSRTDGTRRNALAHRAAYEELVGPVPEGAELDHLCRRKACWNPLHVEPVPHRVNMKRSAPFSRRYGKIDKTKLSG
jgi:hypothetical protein